MKLGITMIDMYCSMIKEQFDPILETLRSRDFKLLEQCEIEAKKELGIYDKMVKLSQLKLQTQQLEEELELYTKKDYHNGHRSKVDRLADEKMKVVRNGFHDKVNKAMQDMIYKIRLSGLDNDTKKVFDELPGVINSLVSELKQLPPPTQKLIKAKK